MSDDFDEPLAEFKQYLPVLKAAKSRRPADSKPTLLADLSKVYAIKRCHSHFLHLFLG